ncbi:glycosyl hydrolase [uncultured Draconibacterium sp.]|uniref:glycosyl hydrolase n=1 Tax=uncultured Draconibacterium sp. TaxID=1573823 RepID=UPI003217CCAD
MFERDYKKYAKKIKKVYNLRCLTIGFIILFAGNFSCAQNGLITPKNFKNSPKSFRPVSGNDRPLPSRNLINHLNTNLNVEGFGGFMWSPDGNDYLGEAYFDSVKVFLDFIKETGHKAVFYDEVGFPSGSANKSVPKKYYRKELIKYEEEVSGPVSYSKEMPSEGWLMAVVAMNSQTLERIDLTPLVQNKKLIWDIPSGQWKVMIFNCNTTKPSGNGMVDHYNATADPLDPEAVEWFINTVYEPHAKHIGEYFGNTVNMCFFDDVGIYSNDRTWAQDFNDKFKKRMGIAPEIYYPALWYNIGPETEAARFAFFDTRAEMLADGFPKLVTEWGENHNLKVTGHAPGNYEMQPVDMIADPFKFYRVQPIPLADVIFDYPHGRPGFKLISDGGELYDKPIIGAETFSVFVPGGLKSGFRRAMELYIRGINLFFGANMGMPNNSFFKKQNVDTTVIGGKSGYAEWAGRNSLLLQGGRRVSEIAILYPIESLEAFYYFGHPDLETRIFPSLVPYAGNFVSPETDYQAVGEMLLNKVHCDFTFIHPDIFNSDKISIIKSTLNLNNKTNWQSYKVLLIPGGKVISLKTLHKVKKFYDAGGTVVATTMLPSIASELPVNDKEALENNAKAQAIIKDIFGIDPIKPMPVGVTKIKSNAKNGKAVFISKPGPEILTNILNELGLSRDVSFVDNPTPTSGLGAFSYVHRVKDGLNIYFLANSTDDEVNTFAELRGKIKPEIWNPHNGEIMKIDDVVYIKKQDQDYTRFRIKLDPVRSTFIVGK